METTRLQMLGEWWVLPKDECPTGRLDGFTQGALRVQSTSYEDAYQQACILIPNWIGKKLVVTRSLKSLFPFPSFKEVTEKSKEKIPREYSVVVGVPNTRKKKKQIDLVFKDGTTITASGYQVNDHFAVVQYEGSWQVINTPLGHYVMSTSTLTQSVRCASWLGCFITECEHTGLSLSTPILETLQKMVNLYYGGHVLLEIRI